MTRRLSTVFTTSCRCRHTPRQTVLMVRANGHVYDARWQIEEVGLEDVVLADLQSATQAVAS